jgi:hypothetical protein
MGKQYGSGFSFVALEAVGCMENTASEVSINIYPLSCYKPILRT